MSKASTLEPVAVVASDFDLLWAGSGPIAIHVERHGVIVGSRLVTIEQAEAYAAAKVREALEQAADVAMLAPLTASMMNSEDAKAVSFHTSARIRALLPSMLAQLAEKR